MHAWLIMASGKDNIFNMWPTMAGPAGQGTGGWADSLGWSMQLSHSGSPQPPNHEEKPRLEALGISTSGYCWRGHFKQTEVMIESQMCVAQRGHSLGADVGESPGCVRAVSKVSLHVLADLTS